MLVGFGDLVHLVEEFVVLLGECLVLGLDRTHFAPQVLNSLLVEGDVFVFLLYLLVEGCHPELELVLVILTGQPQGLELVGEEGYLVVLVPEHVHIALVFFLESGYLIVLLVKLCFEEVNFLLENGPLLFHFHFDHLEVHFLLLDLLLSLGKGKFVLLLERLFGFLEGGHLLLELGPELLLLVDKLLEGLLGSRESLGLHGLQFTHPGLEAVLQFGYFHHLGSQFLLVLPGLGLFLGPQLLQLSTDLIKRRRVLVFEPAY